MTDREGLEFLFSVCRFPAVAVNEQRSVTVFILVGAICSISLLLPINQDVFGNGVFFRKIGGDITGSERRRK